MPHAAVKWPPTSNAPPLVQRIVPLRWPCLTDYRSAMPEFAPVDVTEANYRLAPSGLAKTSKSPESAQAFGAQVGSTLRG
jgi:hypothetical protein